MLNGKLSDYCNVFKCLTILIDYIITIHPLAFLDA